MRFDNSYKSVNFSERQSPVKYVILHYTEVGSDEALHLLTSASSQVSAHYFIKDNGVIFRLVEDDKVAWHAGKSYWRGEESLNSNSIGIELDNSGQQPFSQAQMQSCLELCLYLKEKYDIKRENFLAHSDIAPDRKIDPGIFFDWSYLAKAGIGIASEAEDGDKIVLFRFGDFGQHIAELQTNFKKIGYKIEVNGEFDQQTNFVIRAFQLRFNQKIIQKYDFSFFKDTNSRYEWCKHSQLKLEQLLTNFKL